MNVFKRTDILLPQNVEMERWAVIACDQFTSDREYWKRVRKAGDGVPSAIHMILPEAELGITDEATAVAAINTTMEQYLKDNIFRVYPNSYIYVERTLGDGSVRPGLLGAVDLEEYDYHPGSGSPIRATEQTVLERIPPRQRVRKDAKVELPHVLMLCDDDKKMLIEPIQAMKDQLHKLYDFQLMERGGRIQGWLLTQEAADAFDARFASFVQSVPEKYADLSGAAVVLAVGDGNHSLATAKSCYEALKANGTQQELERARYSLVELQNIHDSSLVFAPIHRIITGTDANQLLEDLRRSCGGEGYEIGYVLGETTGTISLDRGKGELAVAVLQEFLDQWLKEHPGEIDYIHGDDEVRALASGKDSVGFLLPPMEKHQLFRGVISGGSLPRKTFSMGHAREKRYYLEGRVIR